jgi:hypothetical protein
MIKLITEEVRKKVLYEIKLLFDGKVDSVKIDCFCPSEAIKCLEELGAEESDDFDTNGWQYDYWIKLEYNGKKYCLSGSGYYGNLTIAEDN